MQAHTVVILTSGLLQNSSPDALDLAITELLKRKKTAILVLGKDGDAILEQCSRLEDCELVFDPNDNGEFSGVKAGLHATNAAAFIWRMDRPFPTSEAWSRLEATLRLEETKKTEVFGIDSEPSGLLLVTARGNKHLKERPSDSVWPVAQDIVFTSLSEL